MNQRDLQSTKSGDAAGDGAASGRRRLLRGGLAAGPVLMTVASRPVMASVCVTSSAHASLTGSRQVATQDCQGGTPAYWVLRQQGGSGYLMQAGGGTPDKRTFGNIFANPGIYATKTLVTVMNEGKSSLGPAGVAAHLVAAVLNAERGMTPSTILSVAKAQAIWFDYTGAGFSPTAGVKPWSDSQIIDWLKTTMPLNS